MAIQTYTVPSDKIVHHARVDFSQRCVNKTIHVVQYDKSLPVIAVELFLNGSTYTLPANADVKVRWGKKDHTFIYKNVLGCDITRKIVYFDIDEQMTYFNGPCNPILEVIVSGNKAGSSSIPFEVDRNPIQEGDIRSESEYVDLEAIVQQAINARDDIIAMGDDIYTKEEVYNKTEIEGFNVGIAQRFDTVEGDISFMQAITPSQANPENQLADKDFVNSSLNSIAAYYITKDVSGNAFENYAQLKDAAVVYSGGEIRVPTRNDYAIVRVDEDHDNETTRYIYQNGWQYQYTVNETSLTAEQLAAINSGITTALVSKLSGINMDSKVDKVSTSSSYVRAYTILPSGSQGTIYITDNVLGNTVVSRNTAGQIKLPLSPTNDEHATSKAYVDSKAPTLTQLPDGSYSLEI